MATRKQRRRRDKEKRHEYDLVYVDDAGNEVEPDPSETQPARKAAKASTGAQSRRRGNAQEPSWPRTLKRAGIFAPVMFVTVLLLGGTHSTVGNVVQTIILVALFIPFSYVLDSYMWRSQQKREARARASSSKRGL